MLGFPLCFFLRKGLFFYAKLSLNARELKTDLLKSAHRAGGLGGRERATFSKEDTDFHTTSTLPLGLPPGGEDGLTQVLGQLLIPLGFT